MRPRLLSAGLALSIALLCGLCLPLSTQAEPRPLPQPEGMVAQCLDGDTIKLRDRRMVRLAGIDTPELGKGKKQKTQYYAREARALLQDLAKGHSVRLMSAGVKDKDRHGRLVAEVLLEDGRSLNELMLAEGAAYYYPHRDQNPHFQDRLKAIQVKAISEKRGLWAELLSLPLARNNYTGNRNSLRFFPADCPEAQKIKPRNRVYFGTLMDAFLQGYAPGRTCLFWPAAKNN